MASMTETKPSFDEGREAQFREMMKQLALLQGKYKGVRGELLEKVRAELMALKPSASASTPAVSAARAPAPEKIVARAPAPQKVVARAPAPGKILPSCRVCGRGMTATGDGSLICAKGHTRSAA